MATGMQPHRHRSAEPNSAHWRYKLGRTPKRVLLRLLGIMVWLVVCQAAAKDFLWRVRSSTATVYLLGSIHVLRSGDYPLPASFEPAFLAAQRAVFEIDLDEAGSPEVGAYLLSKAAYPPGQTIRGALTPSAYQKLQNLALASGLPATFFDPYRPWFASSVVSDLQAGGAGFQDVLGVDRHFFDRSRVRGLPILYLETARDQIDALASTPDAEWAGSLEEEIDEGAQDTITIATQWKAGDIAAIAQSIDEGAAQQPGIHQALLVNRNLNWLPQVEGFLNQTVTTIVIAGAAHFVGTNGLVMMLEARGYEVVQLPGIPPSITSRLFHYQPTVGLTNATSFPPDATGPGPDVTLVERTAFDLTVGLNGDGPFRFQWREDLQPISGATNAVFRKANLRVEDAGMYDVEIQSDFGTVTSSGLRVAVVPAAAPGLAISMTGSNAVLTLQGTTNAHYRLEFGELIPGATNWQVLRGVLMVSPQATITDTNALTTAARRFYRAAHAP